MTPKSHNLAALLLATLLALSPAAFAHQIEQLTFNSDFDQAARINGRGDVTWLGLDGPDPSVGANYQVFLHDAASGLELRLTSGPTSHLRPRINENGDVFWDGGMAWNGSTWDFTNLHTFLNRHDTGQVEEVTVDGATVRGAVVNVRGDVLFVRDGQLFLALADGELLRITDNPTYKHSLALSDNGHAIWVEADGAVGPLFLFDSTTRQTIRVNSATQSAMNPSLNNHGDVVWEEWTLGQVLYYRHDTGTVEQISNDPAPEVYEPKINDARDVIWTGGSPGFDVFYRDGETGVVQKLTANAYPWYGYWDIDLAPTGDAVWIDWGPPTGTELYLYRTDLDRVFQVTADGDPHWPRMNAGGVIVWDGTDPIDGDSEVFRALPPTPSSLASLVTDLEAQGEIDPAAADQMRGDLATAEAALAEGKLTKAISALEQFRTRVEQELHKGRLSVETATRLTGEVDLILADL